ncbi:MAG TPA: hypothetical protein HPP66_05980 [Planctomycetes bacterium]|nr:hypothetical protein [Planctomycetota bacterium]
MAAKTIYHRNVGFGNLRRIISRLGKAFILSVTLVLASSYLLAADPVRSNPEGAQTSNGAVSGSVPVQARYRVFAFRHISTEQARNFLAEARLGTVSQLPTANMLLVTAQPRQLIKATAILKIIDADTPFVMKAILPASAAKNLPLNEQIAAEIGGISIGSFSHPPSGVGKAKAIIDVHDDAVVVIAPADQLDKIIEAVEKYASNGSIKHLQKAKADVLQPIQPQKTLEPGRKEGPKADRVENAELERVKTEMEKVRTELNHRNGTLESEQAGTDASGPESNGLFTRLLDSLNEAEKKVAELAKPPLNGLEPNEPTTRLDAPVPVTEPEKSEPNKPSVDLKQAEETAVETDQPPEKPDVAAVPEKPEDKKKAAEPPQKPDVAVIPEKSVKKPGAEKITARPKPEPEKVTEQARAKVEEPNQVAPILQEEPNTVTQVVEPAVANGPYQPELATIGDDTLELDMPPKINIIDLLDLVGKYLDLNYMYDPADLTGLKGEVTLVLQGPIKIKDLYPLAESVLRFKGFVMTRRGNLVTIVPKTKVFDIDAPIVDPKKPRVQAGNVIITRIFELEHIDTASAQNLLTAMKLGVTISPIPDMKTIIITGYAYRMSRIEQLIDMVDKPGEEKKFRSRALKYTMAKTLATKVKALAEQLGTVSIAIGATAAAAPTSTARRPGESTAVYQRRLQAARAAALQRAPSPTATTAEPTVYLDADERTNRILMIGLEEQLTVVDTLIETLDVEQQDLRTLRLYEIQNVDAEEVMIKLSELGIISGGRGTTGRATTRTDTRTTTARPIPGRPTTTRPTTATATGTIEEPLVEEPQVVIIEPTNSLLVNATAEQHVRIAIIIGYVDAEQEVGQNPYVIYQLENQDPEELFAVLEKLISETITEKSGTGAEAKVVRTTTRKNIEEDIIIVPDPKTYSLIVYASKKNQQWIASLIKELDAYRPQVLLDVTLVEITRDDEFSYDLDMISQIVPGAEQMSILGQTGFLSAFPGNTIIEAINTGAGLGKYPGAGGQGFLTKGRIQALFKIMEYRGYGRILARPKLLVNDNEEGTITTEDTIYIAKKQTKYIPTTGQNVQQQYQPDITVSFEAYQAGIELTIQPHISKGDQLQLTITLNRTDFDKIEGEGHTFTTLAGEKYPKPLDTSNSNVQTIVTVPDGKTIILGGLEKTSQSKGGGKIPLLGNIPLIGGLFRNASNASVQRRLYVFVKAHILRPGEEFTGISDIEVVSLKNRATFERYEKEMQEYEDWPGIKPKPMEPLRVLETDEDEVVSLKKEIGI